MLSIFLKHMVVYEGSYYFFDIVHTLFYVFILPLENDFEPMVAWIRLLQFLYWKFGIYIRAVKFLKVFDLIVDGLIWVRIYLIKLVDHVVKENLPVAKVMRMLYNVVLDIV